ncbi:MAG TPA: hypothetical protein VLL54_17675 [Pyrinomonadaceae bacterium]|nr:hypothetical protein [Pyrinomonadaceae bacterium]
MNSTLIHCRRLVLLLGLSLVPVFVQANAQAGGSTAPAIKNDAAKVEQLFKQSGYSYRNAGEGIWLLEREGKNLTKFKVIFATGPGFLVTGVVVATKDSMDTTPEMMLKLLKLAHSLDFVKIGLDDDDDLFVRSEIKTASLDLAEFKESVERVSNDADQIYAAIKPFLK